MLPEDRLELAETCERMYRRVRAFAESGGGGEPLPTVARLNALAREVAERGEDLTRYELSAEALAWNFEGLIYLIRWTWLTLHPPWEHAPPPPPGLAVWDKPASEMTQAELRESLRALEIRWIALSPTPELWRWVSDLERRAADLCVRTDLSEALDEARDERDGGAFAPDEFVTDLTATFADMMRAQFVQRDVLVRAGGARAPPRRLPVEGAEAWLAREREKLTSEAVEVMEGDLARYATRPGEVARYSRSHLGIVPDDARVVMRHCRPPLSDYRRERPMEPYLVFGRSCGHRAFDWISAALLTDRDYFARTHSGSRCGEIMFAISEPTVLRIMGADYVCIGPRPGSRARAWRCSSPAQALCLWISLASPLYVVENERWDLGFLKEALEEWRVGERIRETAPVFV